MIDIHQARPDDAIAMTVAKLHIQGWQDGYEGLLPPSYLKGLNVFDRAETWKKRLEMGSVVWIATYHQIPAAVIAFGPPINPIPFPSSEDMHHVGEISMLYTCKEFYRLGLGTALFRQACASLKAQGCDKIFLWVLEANQKGRAFYDKSGGTVIPHVQQSVTIDGMTFQEVPYSWAI